MKIKQHSKETLKNWNKERLIEHIMCLEHNYNVMDEGFEIQYSNCIKLLDDMKILNTAFTNRNEA